ncbi:hypothetical protein GCM10010324_44480 [Streptomyces hiroshimensis]|uniref:Uncharacterized protein n=1 Tax=Streptomyces hiroshimensis TaxID=66424 RepID=A0ABQ2YV20_9ACTN|nr:hypothetical protein GCM10010324_44480 [Streptomyces hiroshimensis]
MTSDADSIPLFWSTEGRTAEVVQCHFGHLGFRETFETVGGCPYCTYTPGERQAALRALGAHSSARRRAEKNV